ncbi:synaptoporin isoform X2 [Magallana gigas]|uniref:synaptoporin isoform X2 n=1 Tax=Magallana gigas TaxID=29159 RepID=UPI003341B719
MDVEVRIIHWDHGASGRMIVTVLSLRIMNLILAIFAFATTTSVDTFLTVTARGCSDAIMEKVDIAYPFDIQNSYFTTPLCNRTSNPDGTKVYLLEGSRSSAEFYVFFGVMVFLYCIAALVVYLFFEELYRRSNVWSIVDFVISAVITLLWLISSSAWAQGLVNLKYYTDLKKCGLFDTITTCSTDNCVQTEFPNFGSLNASVIFGFLNMLVWGGNLWFLYKETPWFQNRSEGTPQGTGGLPEGDPQRI